MAYSTTIDDFKLLKNGIDNNITIIQHIPTGYYNITKINNLIYNLINNNNSNTLKKKDIYDWMRLKSSKEIIEELQLQMNTTDNLIYELDNNTNNDFKGTYVHKLLYDHILMWIDRKYAIKIGIILNNIHENANIEKDNKINELTNQMKELLNYVKNSNDKINNLTEEAIISKDMISNLTSEVIEFKDEIVDLNEVILDSKEEIQELNEKVEEVRDVVKLRNADVNIRPDNNEDLHMFIILQDKELLNKLIVKRGQFRHISKYITDENYNIIINMTYNPNPIDLWVTIREYFKTMILNLKEEIMNDRRKKKITVAIKQERLNELRNNPPIKISNCNIRINFDKLSLDEFKNIIKEFDERRFNLPTP